MSSSFATVHNSSATATARAMEMPAAWISGLRCPTDRFARTMRLCRTPLTPRGYTPATPSAPSLLPSAALAPSSLLPAAAGPWVHGSVCPQAPSANTTQLSQYRRRRGSPPARPTAPSSAMGQASSDYATSAPLVLGWTYQRVLSAETVRLSEYWPRVLWALRLPPLL